MNRYFFATDLHGHPDRYEKLFAAILKERPGAVFLGGDLLPSALLSAASGQGIDGGFLRSTVAAGFQGLRDALGKEYPEVFLILGNDDGAGAEPIVLEIAGQGLWHYAHGRRLPLDPYAVYGYAFVPPTPFRLKDWERYDVSRYVDPGCISPEEGFHSASRSEEELRHATIRTDLERLANDDDLDQAIFLFHTPPHDTPLDRAGLDGLVFEHVPLDPHVGSIAVRRFLETRQPLVSLHGHVHEAARISGTWKTRIGRTFALSAAHDGPELALVRFDPQRPEEAARELL